MSEDNSSAPRGERISERESNGVKTLLEQPRSLPMGSGSQWISSGFKIFKLNPMAWVLISLTFLALMVLASMNPILSIISSVLSPVLLAGFYVACHELEEGKEINVGLLFAGFKVETRSLIRLGVLYTGGSLLIAVIASLAINTGGIDAESIANGTISNEQAMALLSKAGGPLVLALVLTIPLTMAYAFAPQLVMFHGMTGMQAMKASYRGAMKNIWPFLGFGVFALLLSFLAALTFGIGFVLLVPVITGAMYIAYQQIFLESPSNLEG